ncbi:MAG: hypothetical protein WD426_12705 [Anditalea sp.]
MTDGLTISTQKPSNPAFDYQELRKLGIEHIEKTASAIWTDYNIHDPGITTLEFLCYAITDLSYRTEFSIPDLLATQNDTVENIHKHFISAKKIFPNKAVTVNDYRKLLIEIKKIKNAWISQDTKTVYADQINKKLSHTQPNSRKWEKVTLRGYYQVLLEFDTIVADEEKEEIKREVKKVLMDNRNLCEDFTKINEVKKEEFRLCSEIEIASNADPIQLLAKVFFNIQVHLTPLVKFYRLAELLAQNYTTDKIFEGSLLEHGFIKEEELIDSKLKTEIYLSDIIHQILEIEGVANIIDIQLNALAAKEKNTVKQKKWVIDVTDESQPIISIFGSKIVLYKEGMPFRPELNRVKQRFDELMDAYISANEEITTEDLRFETGTYRNINSYYSIQNHYPQTYGISHWGLPKDASTERKYQAKQLQGYLYFFDQQLANYLAQLSNINKLFSLQEDVKQTYFTQLANDFIDANSLFTLPLNEIKENIQKAAENPETFDQRRNLFLDHLLSRFSESFFDYVNILHDHFPAINGKELIQTKIQFLKNYPEYSSKRFAAFNITNDLQWNSDNTSGQEKRLQSLLGISDINRRSLVNMFSVIKRDSESGANPFYFELIDNRSGNTLMVAAEKFPSEETAERQLAAIFDLGKDFSLFSIRATGDNSLFIIELKDRTGNVLGVSPVFHTQEEAMTGLTGVHTLLTKNRSEEGIFLIENLLLLPDEKVIGSPVEPNDEGAFMPICVDENCEDCDGYDPYSFRINIILPAYAGRFLNLNFRRYCERIIRMETPAHIFPKICWVNNEQLQEFEKAYQDWLQVKAGLSDDGDGARLKRFIHILTTLKTVYPPARLQDCSSLEERQLFLLSQNALGTLKN